MLNALLFRVVAASIALVNTPVAMASAGDATCGGAALRPIAQGATHAGIRCTNHQLEKDVRRALYRAKVDTSDISILARSGTVTLIGGVPDQGMIENARTAAVRVTGVLSVDNELIRRPEGY